MRVRSSVQPTRHRSASTSMGGSGYNGRSRLSTIFSAKSPHATKKSITAMPRPKRFTVPEFTDFKRKGQKITMLTAYDFPTARLVDEAGIEGVLVGDTLSMVVQGRENTLPVT